MSQKISLLDCTLRDGGYVNDWHFGRDNIVSMFERLVSAGVDIIEVGFLDQRRMFDPARTIMPDTHAVDRIFGKLNRGNSMVVAMIDYGTCDIENVQPCNECWLDGIRVIFKKEIRQEALAFCKQVKELGYKVFVQAVSITSYTEEELKDLVSRVNAFKPYALSMVDTYGLLNPTSLLKICRMIDKNLDRDISLGFHSHNNFQLGYANSMSMLTAELNRNVLVDGTLYGMGKSAGNAPIELLAMYLNQNYDKQYDVLQMQEAISTSVLDMYQAQPWGYTLFYYIAAANQCHPDYVSYLMNKRTLSITAINEILQQIPVEKKLGKDKNMLEELYLAYQSRECDDTQACNALCEQLQGKHVLMIGPGVSIKTEEKKIQAFIQAEKPSVISINYIPQIASPDYLFLTNSKRYLEISSLLVDEENRAVPIIATSNVSKNGGRFSYVLNYSSLIDPKAEFPDNSMVMLLKILEKVGAKKISMAGFDGYTPNDINYFNSSMEYDFVKKRAESLNAYASQFLTQYMSRVELQFITPTRYL